MKNSIIISLLILAVVAFATGCFNKDSKAQALLVEAISYSDGTVGSEAARTAALKLAEAKGTKPGPGSSGLTQREVIMVASRELCNQILTEYPDTPAAIKAAELITEINQGLRTITNARISSMYESNY